MEDYKSEKSILDHLARLNINPKILENPTAKTIILGIIGNRINSLLAANSGTNEIENMYNNDIYVDFNGNFSFQDFYRGVDSNGAEVSKNFSTNIEVNEKEETIIDNSERKYDISLDNLGSEQFTHNSRNETKIIQDANFIDILREDTKVDKDFNKVVKTIKRNADYVTGTLDESIGNENTNKMNPPESSKIIIMANKNNPKKIGAYIRFEKVTEQIYDLMTKQQNEILSTVPGLKVAPVPEIENVEPVAPIAPSFEPAPEPTPAPAPEPTPAPVTEAPVVPQEPEPTPAPEAPVAPEPEVPTEPEAPVEPEPEFIPAPEPEPIAEPEPDLQEPAPAPEVQAEEVKVEAPEVPVFDDVVDEVKEEPAKEEAKEEIKEEIKEETKEEVKVEMNEEVKEEVKETASTDAGGMSIEEIIAMRKANKESIDKIVEDENKMKAELLDKKNQLLAKALSEKEKIEKMNNDLLSMRSELEKLNEALLAD